jgi:hypothetical protein
MIFVDDLTSLFKNLRRCRFSTGKIIEYKLLFIYYNLKLMTLVVYGRRFAILVAYNDLQSLHTSTMTGWWLEFHTHYK